MRKTTYFFALLALCSSFALTSCGDDDPVPPTESFEQNNAENNDNSGENKDGDTKIETGNSQTINVKLNSDGTFEGGGLIFKQTSHTSNTVVAHKTSEAVDKTSFDGCFIVPAYIECEGVKYAVTSLGDNLFYEFRKMTEISLPTTLLTIGSYAFGYCDKLTSVEIPNSVTSVGMSAFYGCKSLKSVMIPNSVTEIGNLAFYDCSSLTSVEIPNSVTTIGRSAFAYCTSLTSVEIPKTVTSIGIGAFAYCSSLTSVEIPTSVTSIGMSVFRNCSSLKEVKFNATNSTLIIDESVINYQITLGPFNYCDKLSIVSIGENVQTIPAYAFYNCQGLTSIVIPSSVTTIGKDAFGYYPKLKEITSLNTTPPSAKDAFWYETTDYCVLKVPSQSVSAYKSAEGWKEFKNIVAMSGESESGIVQGIYHASGASYFNGSKQWDVTLEKDTYNSSEVWIYNILPAGAPRAVYGIITEDKTELHIPVSQITGVTSSYDVKLGGFYGIDGDEDIPDGGYITGSIMQDGTIEFQDWFGTEAFNKGTITAAGWYELMMAPVVWKLSVADNNAVTSPKAQKKVATGTYNQSGQKVGKEYRGIVIQNGKKIMRR